MNLTQLEKFRHIVIQCHDNPDADALASGFALYSYFKAKGKQIAVIDHHQREMPLVNGATKWEYRGSRRGSDTQSS